MKMVIMIAVIVLLLSVLFHYLPFMNGTGMDSPVYAKKAIERSEDDYVLERRKMVKSQIAARGVKDKRVIEAMKTVPRHLFVPEELRGFSYQDAPFPIGLGQTISQPYIVALMTEMLELDNDDIVLEIGTGSGYQAAVLATIVQKVYTIEIIDALGIEATERLRRLGYHNVEVKIADGSHGWPDKSPFDAIIVTAAAEKIPSALIQQLKRGGRLVIPVDNFYRSQDLLIVQKDDEGETEIKKTIPVRFVPLVKEREVVK